MERTSPSLFIDLDIVRSNIERMSKKAIDNKLELRPHFKTHQSRDIGKIFREFGVSGITVSSVKMARYFAEDGWDDITIAFPVNVLAANDYNELSSSCSLKTLIISSDVLQQLDSELENEIGLYIEIDPGYGRSGVPVSETNRIRTLIGEIDASRHCFFSGFYCHAGHTYKCRSEKEIQETAGKALEKLQELKSEFPDYPVCYGDTPSCSVLQGFGPIDQLSPGNFVFYDWMQVEIGSCTPNEIAVYMECPVIEKFADRNQVLIHGGAVHFSKDSVRIDDYISYGEPRLKFLSKETYVKSLSQEHGIIQCNDEVFSKIKIGETIQIFPVHSCLTANLMRSYHTIDGRILDHMNGLIPV